MYWTGQAHDPTLLDSDLQLLFPGVVYNLHACIHKSIPNVLQSLSAKHVLTGRKKMFYFTHHIFKHKIHCEKLKSAHPNFAYCSKRYKILSPDDVP